MAKISVGRHLRKWAEDLLDLIFPPRCVGCGAIGSRFCPRCAQNVLPTPFPVCPRCGRPQRSVDRLCNLCRQESGPALRLVRAAALHTDPLRPAIHALKYEDQPELASLLARYLIAVCIQPPFADLMPSIDAAVPVPLHKSRLAVRGYNQSALLAQGLAGHFGLPVAEGWLVRARETRTQVGLTALERRQNVADAFLATKDVQGKRLLLVDDVFTTGSTLTACAAALRAAGAVDVVAVALATPPPPRYDEQPELRRENTSLLTAG